MASFINNSLTKKVKIMYDSTINLDRLRVTKEILCGIHNFSDDEILMYLEINIPYKCFNKRKYKWKKIYHTNLFNIPIEFLQTTTKLKYFMWVKYQENRKELRSQKIINKL